MIKNLVSICIPTFNGEHYLTECLESINEQTYLNCEVIISDDGSTDNTLNLVNNYISTSKYPVRVIYNAKINKGIGGNWNNCVKASNGEFIKFLFQDDILFPECISKMVAAIIKSDNIGFVYSKRHITYDIENQHHLYWLGRNEILHESWDLVNIKNGDIVCGKMLLKDSNLLFSYPNNKFGEPTALLIRSQVFSIIGLFNTNLKQSLDYECWNRILKRYSVIYLDEELVSFRLHENQYTAVNRKNNLNESYLFHWLTTRNLWFFLHRKSKMRLLKINILYFFKIFIK
jgi:glycosyltransferase involved in cell wall biosynthesis